jgi:polysaccharide pyruvyl transferase WcaK-like protein
MIRKHVFPAEYFMAKKRPIAVVGVGAGPLTNYLSRAEVVRICNYAKVVAVRDIESYAYLAQYGARKDKIFVTADVALSINKESLDLTTSECVSDLFGGMRGPYYGINISVDLKRSDTAGKAKQFIREIASFLNSNPEICPIFIMDHENANQEDSLRNLSALMDRDILVYRHRNFKITLAIFAKLNVILTNKLHMGIVGYSLGVLPLSFPTHSKTERFYRQIEQPDLCRPYSDLKPGDVSQALNRTRNDAFFSEFEEKRAEKFPELQQAALLNKTIMHEFVSALD